MRKDLTVMRSRDGIAEVSPYKPSEVGSCPLRNRTRTEQHLWRSSNTIKIRGRIDHCGNHLPGQTLSRLLFGGSQKQGTKCQSLVVADFSSGTASVPFFEQRAIDHLYYFVSTFILCAHFNFCMRTFIILCTPYYLVKNCYVSLSFGKLQIFCTKCEGFEGSTQFFEKAQRFWKISEKRKVFGKSVESSKFWEKRTF
jgi:hypothetical protein